VSPWRKGEYCCRSSLPEKSSMALGKASSPGVLDMSSGSYLRCGLLGKELPLKLIFCPF